MSITEYRQRKKINNNEIGDKSEETINTDECINEENNSSESLQMTSARPKMNSPSSSSSSSDDETSVVTELPAKGTKQLNIHCLETNGIFFISSSIQFGTNRTRKTKGDAEYEIEESIWSVN